MAKCMLTTIDNPFNPFTNFEQWFDYDCEKGYYSCSYLARIAKTSDMLSEKENDEEIERAINEIIQYNPLGIYVKVKENETITENNGE